MVAQYKQQVLGRAAYQQGVEVRANPSAFGADIGQGLQSVGRGIAVAGEAIRYVQERDAEALAKEQDAAFADDYRREMFDPTTGFMFKQGRNAVDGLASHEERLRALKEQRIAELQKINPRAAEMFRQSANQREQDALTRSTVHGGQERVTVVTQAAQSRASAFQNDALALYNDPAAVQKNLDMGLAEVRQLGADKGWDAATLQQAEQKYRSDTHLAIATRIAMDDPIAADKYVADQTSNLLPADAANFREKLKTAVITEKGGREASRILQEVVKRDAAGGGAPSADGFSAVGMTAQLLRAKEGFRSSPYYDVDALRTGYGSDTVTRADGTVERVTASTRVTREDAERDLERRIREFQSGIVKSVGMQPWMALDEPTRAALTSVAYNYGSLPNRVAQAVMTGDKNAIAAAVESLSVHNNGVNAGRRRDEANLIRTGAMPSGGGSKGWSGVSAYSDVMAQLAAIEDPEVREIARKQVTAALELQSKAEAEQVKALKSEAFQIVAGGGDPMALPMEVQAQLGVEGMQSLFSYQSTLAKQGEIKTDEVVFSELNKQWAKDPEAFAEIDLTPYREKLSKEDYRSIEKYQTDFLADQTKEKGKAAVLNDVNGYIANTLDSVGLTSDPKDQERTKQRAMFELQMKQYLAQVEETNGRPATQAEARAIADGLLLPYIVKTPGTLWNSKDEMFGFELSGRPTTSTVEPAIKYEDIPIDLRLAIEQELAASGDEDVSPEDVARRYAERVQLKARKVLPNAGF